MQNDTNNSNNNSNNNSKNNKKKAKNPPKNQAQQAQQGGQVSPSNSSKPRLLCLHGKYQSGASFANKIAGARRKLERHYDLDFLDGPIWLNKDEELPAFAWWLKDDTTGEHVLVQQGMEYVLKHIQQQQKQTTSAQYQGLIGFSQGGALVTALSCSGLLPTSIKAIVTAGAPMVQEAFDVAETMKHQTKIMTTANFHEHLQEHVGQSIPKLHLAGQTDAMIPVASTAALCQRGGNGRLIVHDQGHLFPTRAARVQEILDFLQETILDQQCEKTKSKHNTPGKETTVTTMTDSTSSS